MTQSFASTGVNFKSPQVPAIQSQPSELKLHSLAALWARKYVLSVTARKDAKPPRKLETLTEVSSLEGRDRTAEKLNQNLTLASAQAWSLTETLLGEEMRRHGINPDLINPLEIAADTRNLFQKALKAYRKEIPPARLSVVLGADCGQVRQKYTSVDRRAIGFASMQFHYTGQKLLECLSRSEQGLFQSYLKVMDDHMYMPLQAAYKAAADLPLNSPQLLAVQHLLPTSTNIAHAVFDRVCRQHPGYESYSGLVSDEKVKISSIRDVEMFQVYLCLCVLQGNICSVQQELFPLCVMLYPRLGVNWSLVQDMLQAIVWELHDRLRLEDVAVFLPYLRTLSEMFSKEVFQNC
ncbi:hypothetical protein [Aerosakkonema funiforme]|uniref:hypothetical protein n=1 Tax=Aerosakkonema funiforme TaxID=1246630 RepID=UPI0035B9D4FD